ncbi:uncharacterized protein [Temnothorax nylanderi]|uniref:uncharacterized protein isoform X2 n=1 Tax=Temnothorax nylanderi TaxID=102681 RepID=UPI003A8814CF
MNFLTKVGQIYHSFKFFATFRKHPAYVCVFSNMDLRNDIKKATSLTSVDDNAKFYRLYGLSQAAKDRKMNERKLLEDSDTNSDDSMDIITSKVKPTFDKYEVSAAIREVNGGRDLSNKHWEESWSRNLEMMTKSEKEIPQNCSEHDNINQPEAKDLNDKYIKQKDRLYRNAAIMGLVRTKKITLQDLIHYDENTARKNIGNESETLHGTAFSKYITDGDKCQVESVPLREDPEVFVHPLQMGIDTKKFKDIDFTVARIGKKTKMTPQAYYLGATDDSCFEFVKKKDSTT